MPTIKKTFQYGDHTVSFETGEIARQADGAVIVNMDDTVVLVTAVAQKQAVPGRDFFPLTVNYQERTYAAGRIPGGFFKREGRPSEKETLTSRLIDRPLRPLFPKGFLNEVQIIATVMSVNPEIDPDVPAMLGASAALAISGIPFNGPIGCARVGYRDGQYLLNPTLPALKQSQLDLVVAGTEQAVLMVESEANELSEDVMLDAVMYGHEQMQTAIRAIRELTAEVGKPAWDWQAPETDESLLEAVRARCEEALAGAYQIQEKLARQAKVAEIREQMIAQFATGEENAPSAEEVAAVFSKIEKALVRGRILAGEPRIDGRDTRTVRPISARVGIMPRTHGSALFTRGETQALVLVTLGTERDSQIIDALEGERRERFLFH